MNTSAVARVGLTRLSPKSTDEDAKIDVILVHGLFGHPYHTWTYEARGSEIHEARATAPEPPKRQSTTGVRLTILKRFKALNPLHRAAQSTTHAASHATDISRDESVEHDTDMHSDGVENLFGSNTQPETGKIFWPHHFLVKDLPNARILTWGYDADVAKAFDFASQSSISQHASQLLSDLANERTTPSQRTRPLILISHSLGGIVVKDAMGKVQTTKLEHLQNILPSVMGVCFLGTPHRGSSTASLGKLAYNITRLIWSHPNTGVLESLKGNSDDLERISERFAERLDEKQFKVHSFRETKPTKGMMIVETFSSRIGDANEGQDELQANHSDMTKFPSRMDPGYRRLLAVLKRWSADIQATETEEVERLMLKSLQSDETRFRMNTVERNHVGTFDWVFSDSVPFRAWLQASESQVFWIRGKPGSGKSTVRKFAMNSEETRRYLRHCSSQPWIISGFFFYDRGSELQKSFRGLLTEILYNLVSTCQEFRGLVLPIYEDLARFQAWVTVSQIDLASIHRQKPASSVYWTVKDLLKGLRTVFLNASANNICLFIDGLDEHGDVHRQMLDLFQEIVETTRSRKTQVKLCLASRPEAEFLGRLRHHPGFQIHEHTASDILTYVRSRLSSGISRTRLEAKKPLIESLVQEISRAADGVFIWARLVADLLLEGLQHGDDARALFDLLREVPTELQHLYVYAVKRMRTKRNVSLARQRRYDFQSYCMFQIALCAQRPIPLGHFMEVLRRAMLTFYSEDDQSMRLDSEHIIQRHADSLDLPSDGLAAISAEVIATTGVDTAEDMTLRLASRSGGLLEHVNVRETFERRWDEDAASLWSLETVGSWEEPASSWEEPVSSWEEPVPSGEEPGSSMLEDLNSQPVQFIHQTAKESVSNTIKKAELTDVLSPGLVQMKGHRILFEYEHSQLMGGNGAALPSFLFHAWHLENVESTRISAYLERLGPTHTRLKFDQRNRTRGFTRAYLRYLKIIDSSTEVLRGPIQTILLAADAGLHLSVQHLLAQYLEKTDLGSPIWSKLLSACMSAVVEPWFASMRDHYGRTIRAVIQQGGMRTLGSPLRKALHMCLSDQSRPFLHRSWYTLLAVLLDSGLDPNTLISNTSSKPECRLLTLAVQQDWLDVASLLLKYGADPELRNKDYTSTTSLEYAVNEKKTAFIQLFEQHTARSG
ncbi:hypothetical protein LTR10_013082 [Elasticomyces elasticus]|uniref:Nephrocystin 3-like N-terminal domain-containing protein n=1 Tax=Exophiala sideris TaxID=1016849 RepID=A0ABR0JB66_9EURO|nr:hypothetical protein LTR10_013082 [Elasticomyces elasticus]KAK5030457.1 hypothetical protein LTS07_005241 [Exophiala sideris]KAK5038510.1 hypothetical protein LTR13_004257 [Exophiala sideris]KAK5060393.1 hypothetical protein LTR69_005710 [Exophiala sideris]KAK5183303.1 hypothetical protein LTR44_004304 [Eurotiomycetes sp. CCFEE 6388]